MEIKFDSVGKKSSSSKPNSIKSHVSSNVLDIEGPVKDPCNLISAFHEFHYPSSSRNEMQPSEFQ